MDFPFFFLFFRERCRRLVGKSASEAVNFDDTDLKVNAGTQRRIVERQTSFRLSVADVFVDPDRLTFPVLDKYFCFFVLLKKNSSQKCSKTLPSADGDHVTVRCHEEFSCVADASRSIRWGCGVDSDPRIFLRLRKESEDERFTGAKVALSAAMRIFGTSFTPRTGTVGSKHLPEVNF